MQLFIMIPTNENTFLIKFLNFYECDKLKVKESTQETFTLPTNKLNTIIT